MKRKNKYYGYNPQTITENKSILVTIVSNTSNDTKYLILLLNNFKKCYLGSYYKLKNRSYEN